MHNSDSHPRQLAGHVRKGEGMQSPKEEEFSMQAGEPKEPSYKN